MSQTDEQRTAAQPNQPLPTEEEHHQQKVDKAAETGDPGSDVQPSAAAAADQLAAMVAPTPAIPARPETATPPTNVPQRQRANLQPLPTEDELEEMEVAAEGVVEIAKKFFWIADEAGDPVIDTGTNSVYLHYPDGSQISVKFECRPGEFQSIGRSAATEAESKARNKKFSDAKKVREDEKSQRVERAKQEADADANAHADQKQPVPVPVPNR